VRLGIQLINFGATVNSFTYKSTVEIAQGETVDLLFQLVDKDQSLRYVPATGATVFVEIARFPEYFPTSSNQRETKDFSIRRYAAQAFAQDASIWKLPLTDQDTLEMMSTNIRVTVVEGAKKSIALLAQGIKIVRHE
jgi:hypothetical protein